MITRDEFLKLEQERNSRIDSKQKQCNELLIEVVDREIRENWIHSKSGSLVVEMKLFKFTDDEIRCAMGEVNRLFRKNGVNLNVMLVDTTYQDYPTVYFKVCK